MCGFVCVCVLGMEGCGVGRKYVSSDDLSAMLVNKHFAKMKPPWGLERGK